jgi:hypothetical protein
VLSKAGTPTENESGTHVIFQQGKTGFVDITSVQMPEDQCLALYFSEDKAAIEAAHQQSLQSASEIQDVPIIIVFNITYLTYHKEIWVSTFARKRDLQLNQRIPV